jgi:uncharacterized membrane protein
VARLSGYFARGLVLVAPIAITLASVGWVVGNLDVWLNLEQLGIPGLGLVLTVVGITLVGFLASNLITRGAIGALDRLFDRLPFIRLLYGAVRDVLNAFVGEKKRFDQPVSVRLDERGDVCLFGFVTQDTLPSLALDAHVSVYCPHSYNFSGQLLVVRSDRIRRLDRPSSDIMAFIVSGGVAGVEPRPPARPLATPPTG